MLLCARARPSHHHTTTPPRILRRSAWSCHGTRSAAACATLSLHALNRVRGGCVYFNRKHGARYMVGCKLDVRYLHSVVAACLPVLSGVVYAACCTGVMRYVVCLKMECGSQLWCGVCACVIVAGTSWPWTAGRGWKTNRLRTRGSTSHTNHGRKFLRSV